MDVEGAGALGAMIGGVVAGASWAVTKVISKRRSDTDNVPVTNGDMNRLVDRIDNLVHIIEMQQYVDEMRDIKLVTWRENITKAIGELQKQKEDEHEMLRANRSMIKSADKLVSKVADLVETVNSKQHK